MADSSSPSLSLPVQVHTIDMELTDAIRQHVVDRFSAALDQHEHRLESIEVTLSDTNGPRGGVDKECEAVIQMRGADEIRVSKKSDDLYEAITVTAHTVRRASGREARKLKEQHRH